MPPTPHKLFASWPILFPCLKFPLFEPNILHIWVSGRLPVCERRHFLSTCVWVYFQGKRWFKIGGGRRFVLLLGIVDGLGWIEASDSSSLHVQSIVPFFLERCLHSPICRCKWPWVGWGVVVWRFYFARLWLLRHPIWIGQCNEIAPTCFGRDIF